MSTYLVGDIHGCYNELIALLNQIKFNINKDTLWLTGDLVARGPKSLEVLRYVKSLENSARIVLGNHDLHFLAIYEGICQSKSKEHIPLLEAEDVKELVDWLRHQPLLQIDEDKRLLMAHAGIPLQWDLETVKTCSKDVEGVLKNNRTYLLFLNAMYGNASKNQNTNLKGLSRLCFITNVFTHMRYCFLNGQLDLHCKDKPESTSSSLLKPWFLLPANPVMKNYTIAFGHWASLEGKGTPDGIYALDTGCCWGKKLTCLRWEDKKYFVQHKITN